VKLGSLSSGVVIGDKFRLDSILGRGSYGDVWLADVVNDHELPPKVALKIYHHQERATRKLLEEARQAITFDHDRLVRVFGADRLDGLVVMWMEYVPGETLLERLGDDEKPRPVSLEEVMAWLHDIAEALAYLHAEDPPLIHSDLKLDNVLLENGQRVRLADFGQSRTIEDCFVETAGAGAWPYLAPEILATSTDGQGKRYVSSDIYAFGVIAYRLLTGRFPRRTLSETVQMLPFPRSLEINPSVPAELDKLVMNCMEKRPQNRFPTGASLLAALEEVSKNLATKANENIAVEKQETSTSFVAPAEQLAELAKDLLEADCIDEVLERLEKAMERMSTSPKVLLLYAEAAKRAGKFDAAYNVYRRARKWMEANDFPEIELKDAVEGEAEMKVYFKKYEEAGKDFRWLAETFPQKRWFRFRYGVVMGLEGRFNESIKILQEVYEMGPPSAMICAKIGFGYLQQKLIDQACQYFNEALMLDEYEPTALYYLGHIRAVQGHHDRARQYLERLEQVEGAESLAGKLIRMLGEETKSERVNNG
jgi:eukaryotic-like serine/threonine-protein kinase